MSLAQQALFVGRARAGGWTPEFDLSAPDQTPQPLSDRPTPVAGAAVPTLDLAGQRPAPPAARGTQPAPGAAGPPRRLPRRNRRTELGGTASDLAPAGLLCARARARAGAGGARLARGRRAARAGDRYVPWDPIIYKLEYTALTLLAALVWLVDRALLFVTLLGYAIKQFIIDTTSGDGGFVLQTLNQMLTGSAALPNLVYLVLALALLVFFFSRILRPILATEPVDPGDAALARGVRHAVHARQQLLPGPGAGSRAAAGHGARRGDRAGVGTFNPPGIPQGLPNQMRAPRHFPFGAAAACAAPPCAAGPASNGLDLAMAFLFVTNEAEVATMTGGNSQHQYMPLLFCQRAAESNPTPPANTAPEDGYGGYSLLGCGAGRPAEQRAAPGRRGPRRAGRGAHGGRLIPGLSVRAVGGANLPGLHAGGRGALLRVSRWPCFARFSAAPN